MMVRRVSLDVIDSTNAEAMRLAAAGERGPLWIVAARQSAGRGRQGRQWDSRAGNLYATLLVSLPVPADVAAQTSFVAALAALDVAAGVLADAGKLALKWPNDVLLDGAKLSGILIETVAQDPGHTTVAIGIGINLAHAPEQTRYGATSLAAHDAPVAPDDAFERLAAAMAARLAAWNDGRGFAVVRRDWTARAAGLGRVASVTMGERTVTGEFTGLASDGALLLSEAGGRLHAIHAGEVSLVLEAP
ncbi:MAG TPA: biotin--[acetyl-CoA-carboxylase] ligase [Aestuariivirgaceae bacterium]|nr:biotin--[acetyl-CoA-carboxylase] ligase [Aestuariivirgaceae bacterium]